MTLEAGAPGALPEGNSRPPVRAIGRGDKPQNARPFATGTPQDTAGLRGQGRSTAYSQVRAGMGPRTPETWAQIGHNCLRVRLFWSDIDAGVLMRPDRWTGQIARA
jgi:hypothetical protein